MNVKDSTFVIGIEGISQQLDKAQIQLIKDITMLDGLYERNKDYFQELNLYIEAGKIKIKEIQEMSYYLKTQSWLNKVR